MEKKIDISVILPSLNVAAYIEETIESVIRQTLRNIEIICVDAGSTDGTLEILREYEKKDSRIKIILSEKKSYGYQINIGMRQAVGRYVAIVDTDDLISADMYEVLYRIALKEDVDFIKADYYEVSGRGNRLIVKRTVPIVTGKDLYNRVIDITEEQQCFQPQITATWSGIYKREFIEKNHIVHNETNGASYQDTGFWFQTYAFASRAYFVNQSFYMYRVDNPNSSVNSKQKIFCICDEYNFVLQRLQEEKLLFVFGNTFSYIFYQKYKRNMERISKAFHLDFLHRFSRDFQWLLEENVLHTESWEYDSQLEIENIIDNPKEYYENVLRKRRKFIKELEQYEQIIIYGAGKIGNDLFHEIKKTEHVLCFAVSEDTESRELEGKPIVNIADLIEYRESAVVVIAVKIKEYKNEMILRSQELAFMNIVTIPYGIMDF